MRSPAAAIGWEFWTKQRWVLVAVPAYLLVLALIKPAVVGPGALEPGDGFAAFGVVPFSTTFMYFIAVFSYGLHGDLSARQSIYPARFFTLPVPTVELARWPMLYGAVAMMLLWFLASTVGRWALNMELPWLWPALLAATVLAWTQVFMWLPYGLRNLRVILAVLVLITLDTIVILAINFQWSEASISAFLAPQLPVAYLCACVAVARARCGTVPDWSPLSRTTATASASTYPPFRSSAAAQAWFEWRRNGTSLPMLVAIVLPFELALPFITGYGSTTFIFELLIFILLTPIVMAGFAGATVSKANPFGREVYGMTPFTATRPLTSAQLIAAKLKMAILSTLAAWVVALVAVPLGFAWSGAAAVPIEWARWAIDTIGIARAIVFALLVLGALMVTTWMMLVQGLYLGLTGREWVVKTSGFAGLIIVMAIGPTFEWISDNADVRRWLWDEWTIFPVALAVFKVVAAIWIARRLSQTGLISDRAMVFGAACWTLAVFLLHAVFVWWVDTPLIQRHMLAVFAILAVPLVRVSAAPLALAWNRHR
jgi:hypothetical protein